MRTRRVKPFEIPVRLLAQKKIWDLKVFYEMAMVAQDWSAFLLLDDDDDEAVGAIIIADNPLYRAVACQTVIVDKAKRTAKRVAETAWIARELTLEEARQRGRPYATCAVLNAQKYLEILGNPPTIKITETLVLEEV